MLRCSLVILAVVLGLTSISVARAEPVRLRAATNAEGARIVMVWESPVAYQASLNGTDLQFNFNRPIDANLSIISGNIPAFVTDTNRSADGLTLSLTLSQPFDLVHYPTGRSIVVDLLGTPGTPAAETAVTADVTGNAVNPATLPDVGVRTGVHADKLRVVFDWDRRVPYEVSQDGGNLSVRFSELADIDVEALSGALPNVLGASRYHNNGEQSIVDLAVAPGATVSDFYAGSKVVIDLFFPPDGSVPGDLISLQSAATAAQTAEATIQADNQPAAEAEEGAAEDAGVETGESASVSAADEVPPAADPGPETQSTSLTATEESAETQTNETAATPVSLENAPQGIVESGASASADGFSLRFDWDEPVAASVFRRGSALWIVFDKLVQIDTASIQSAAGDQLLELVQLPHPEATVLRAITGPGINPVPKREGLAWIFDFSEQALSTLSPVEAMAQPDSPVGARVFMPLPEPGRAVAIVDPEMGDTFVTVPVIPLGYGVTHFYEYPQFRIRPSSQGIVIEPRVDTLRVRPTRQGVGITSTRTLQISPVSDLDIAKARADSDRELSRIVDLEPLQNVTMASFNKRRQELEREVALAPSRSAREEGRFELVRFFLAHAYAAEALGVLEVLADEVPEARQRDDYHVYRGMANYLLGRYDDARGDFEDSQLDNNDEGLFWRTLVEFVEGNEAPEVLRGLRSTGRIPESYPRALRIPLILKVIEAVIRIGDADWAQQLVDALGAENLTPKEHGALLYLAGLNSETAGDYDTAILNFEQATEGEDLPSSVFAAKALAELSLELDRASVVQTIEELETLRFAWRGGKFEFDLLRRLGDLYLSQGVYRQGLSTLRQAARHYRDFEGAEQITQRMSDTFTYLFLNGGADRLPPVTAIAIYEEFKELTPVGEMGDEMIQKLADRLVRVDLLDEAAGLLDGQVKFRLQGVEKARVGAQLAVVRLLNKEYDEALNALDISDESGQSQELQAQRRHLRSRALLGKDEYEAALELLEDDESREAEQLRSEQYWALQDWPRAAQSLRRLIRLDDVRPGDPLAPEDALRILNYAIALTLAGNDRRLAIVREQYGSSMAATDLKDAFVLISTPEQFGLIEANAIPGEIQAAENFQTFLSAYKQRLEEQYLSEIN